MLAAIKSALDIGLQGQVTRLANLAEDYTERTADRLKQQAVSAGVTMALTVTGLAFLLIAVTIGFAALYYWVALWHGTMAGLGAAGGSAMVLALLLFAIVAARTKGASASKPDPSLARIKAEARDAVGKTKASLADVGRTAERSAIAIGKESIDAATGVMRNGSREAVLATLVATVVIGVLVGRRR